MEHDHYKEFIREIIMTEYDIKYQQVQNGITSENEWYQYCYSILCDILEQNKDVFIRMQNEWSGV